jgi:hypothetical protein
MESSISGGGWEFFPHHRVQGPTQLPIQWIAGTLSLGVKRSVCEADHLPPCSAEIKNVWSYTSTPKYVFMAWCVLKHRSNFTLLYFTIVYIPV